MDRSKKLRKLVYEEALFFIDRITTLAHNKLSKRLNSSNSRHNRLNRVNKKLPLLKTRNYLIQINLL